MRVLKSTIFAVAFAAAGSFSAANAAPIQIGSYEADTDLAASSVTVLSGNVQLFDKFNTGVASTDDAIGGSLIDGVRCADANGCSFSINFDQDVINGSGDDLILAGIGVASTSLEEFDLQINGVLIEGLSLVDTGVLVSPASTQLKALVLDLSSFGVALGEAIRSITYIVKVGGNPEELTYVGSLDSDVIVNPIPAAAWLFGTAALGGGFLGRKKRKAAK